MRLGALVLPARLLVGAGIDEGGQSSDICGARAGLCRQKFQCRCIRLAPEPALECCLKDWASACFDEQC
jgi:hypothetical protein